jgi:hypothetical protein
MKPSPMIAKIISVAALLITISAHANPRLEQVPLVWRPTAKTIVTVPPANVTRVTIQIMPLLDGTGMADPSLVGENREDADEGKILPVTSRDNVAAWSTAHLRELLTQSGYDVVNADGELQLSGEVKRFFVTETSTYQSQVTLKLILSDREGQTLWTGIGSAGRKQFGRSYKAENYYEVLTDAFIDAVDVAVSQPTFISTLASHSGVR